MPSTQYVQVDASLTADVTVPNFDDELYLGEHPELQKVVARIGDDPDGLEDEIGEFGVIEAEVTRPAGIGGAHAILKVVIDDPYPLKIATLPGIYVELSVDAYEERIFTGELIKVTQNEEGVVTMEAQDARRDLLSYTVRLDTRPEGVPSTTLIKNLLVKDGPFTEDRVKFGYFPSLEGDLRLEQGGENSAFRQNVVNVRMNVGNDTQPPLYQVVRDIARVQHAYAYIDEYNNFHFRPLPERTTWRPELITKINAGDTKTDNDRTIVEAPRADMLSGTFNYQHASSEVVESEAKQKNGNKNRSRRIRDQNLQSVESANNVAVDNQLINSLSVESGIFTTVGYPLPAPFDKVELDDLPAWTPIPEGSYTITEMKHIINSDDGYLTEVSVGKDLQQIYRSIIDSGRAEKLAENAEPDGVYSSGADWDKYLEAKIGESEQIEMP